MCDKQILFKLSHCHFDPFWDHLVRKGDQNRHGTVQLFGKLLTVETQVIVYRTKLNCITQCTRGLRIMQELGSKQVLVSKPTRLWRNKTSRLSPTLRGMCFVRWLLWLLNPITLATIPQGQLDIIHWKSKQAHLWWLHYDIWWRLCDVHSLHLPPLFFNRLSCTRNVADRHLTFRSENVFKEHIYQFQFHL